MRHRFGGAAFLICADTLRVSYTVVRRIFCPSPQTSSARARRGLTPFGGALRFPNAQNGSVRPIFDLLGNDLIQKDGSGRFAPGIPSFGSATRIRWIGSPAGTWQPRFCGHSAPHSGAPLPFALDGVERNRAYSCRGVLIRWVTSPQSLLSACCTIPGEVARGGSQRFASDCKP